MPLSITKLQERLISIAKNKFESMNHSDQLNPRRLVRAIEIASSSMVPVKSNIIASNPKILGLRYADENLQKLQIHSRVLSRLDLGAVEETKILLNKYSEGVQSMSAIGYKSIIKYLSGEFTKDQMIDMWVNDEMAYVKRQMTWFRKVKSIQWSEIDQLGA